MTEAKKGNPVSGGNQKRDQKGNIRKMSILKKKRKRQDLASANIAKEVAQEISGSKNVAVERKNIPSDMIKFVEKNTKLRFKKRPKLYIFHPKLGHKFSTKKKVGGWDGTSVTVFDMEKGKVEDTVIVMPASHLKDKRLKDSVLAHEMSETIVGQHVAPPRKRRNRKATNSFEHKNFGLVYEKNYLKKCKSTRRQMSNLAKKWWNKEMTKINTKV